MRVAGWRAASPHHPVHSCCRPSPMSHHPRQASSGTWLHRGRHLCSTRPLSGFHSVKTDTPAFPSSPVPPFFASLVVALDYADP